MYSVLTCLYESSKSVTLRDDAIQSALEFLGLPRQAHLLLVIIIIICFVLSAVTAPLIVVDAEEDCLEPLDAQLQSDFWGYFWRLIW